MANISKLVEAKKFLFDSKKNVPRIKKYLQMWKCEKLKYFLNQSFSFSDILYYLRNKEINICVSPF